MTGEGRRARQLDRASELDEALQRIVDVAHLAVGAHAVLYFDLDRQREQAHLRVARGPAALLPGCAAPLGADPFSFVVERGQPFYATDFKRLLWELPWYRGQVKVGSLLVVPVRAGDVIVGALVADRLEIQAFTANEPRLLDGFAGLAAEALQRARASLGREELDAEFKAVYPLSQRLATLSREAEVRELLLRAARHLATLEGGAVAMADDLDTRYVVEAGFGWPAEFLKREVSLDERTWASWVLRSAEESYLLDNVGGQKEPMPVFVLDEGAARAESLLAVPLRARNRTLGALVLTGARGSFDASSRRVLEILANQAAATIQLIKDKEQQRQLAVRDGLTGLYNRRAFNELLASAIANEDRRPGGGLGLVHPRPRPLQEAQRHLRPPRGRRRAALARAPPEPAPAQGRPGGALRGRGVRGDPPRLRRGALDGRRRAPAQRAPEAPLRVRGRAHPPHRELRGRDLAGRREGARGPPVLVRPRPVRRQADGPQPRGRGLQPSPPATGAP